MSTLTAASRLFLMCRHPLHRHLGWVSLCLGMLAMASSPAFGLLTEDVRIPMECKSFFGTAEYNLAAYIHKPNDFDPGKKYPVVIISHGTATDSYTRAHTRYDYVHASEYFLRKGFVAVVPMRRGYGGSDGAGIADRIGSCNNPDYASAAKEGAKDLVAVIAYVKGLDFVDPKNILLAGTSSGGFVSLSAASLNVDGVVGVINFSGGQGGLGRAVPSGHACCEESLVETMGSFGKAKIPTLWIYSSDDSFFGPDLARAMFNAFVRNGGKGRLSIIPPFGHALLSKQEGIMQWAPYADTFLEELEATPPLHVAAGPQ
jgi:pimeloyl-ACP methyl ester carboxylesterase